jgi:hypothetical protein
VAAESRRAESRVNAKLPVLLGTAGASAVTKDISPSGVYLVLPESVESGRLISFRVDFVEPQADFQLYCLGVVVRVERGEDGRLGCGVRIIESKLERGIRS